MRAVSISRTGPPEVLSLVETSAVPRPAPGHVTIDVAYAGVNFADVMFRRGTVRLPLPLVPGIEVAGRIREVGKGVAHLRPGQPVAALTIVNYGGYAEIVATDARLVAPLPSDDDDLLVAAAGTPSNTTTAVLALGQGGHLEPGETLLVHSAASGLGSQLGQVAAALRPASVVGTVGRADKVEAARSFGFDTVVTRDEWLANPSAVPRPDLVVDPVGGPARAASLEVLAPGGRLVVIGNASDGDDLRVGANELFYASRTIAGFSLGALSAADPARTGKALARAVELVVGGDVRVDVNTVLPLEEAVEAHRRVESGTTIGKTVLRVGGS